MLLYEFHCYELLSVFFTVEALRSNLTFHAIFYRERPSIDNHPRVGKHDGHPQEY